MDNPVRQKAEFTAVQFQRSLFTYAEFIGEKFLCPDTNFGTANFNSCKFLECADFSFSSFQSVYFSGTIFYDQA
jgi:uncharacterized protein YjbI with pentapeptide repeats